MRMYNLWVPERTVYIYRLDDGPRCIREIRNPRAECHERSEGAIGPEGF